MERTCIVCHDRPACFRCIQCHKPVCGDCAFKTEYGAFCSRECAGVYREFRRAGIAGRPGRRVGVVRPLIGLILLAIIAAAIAWKMGWVQVPFLPDS